MSAEKGKETADRLSGSAAHQYNELLTVIKGYCDLLLQELGPQQARLRRAAEEIRSAADQAASLTQNLLAPLSHAAPAAEVVQEQAAPVGGSETILLVEDDESVRRLVRETLEKDGYTVLQAKDGAEALQVAREHKEKIHLLLTDLVMPHLGGGQLAEHLALSHPGTRVLYMSSFRDNPIVRQGPEVGAAFLPKPFGLTELARKIREVLDSQP